MILYFSGTGNSKYIAKRIASATNDVFLSLNERIKLHDYQTINVDGVLIIVTPTYCWQLPRLVVNYLKQVEIKNAKGVYFVMTCGGEIGNAEHYNKRLCKQLGLKHLGTYGIIMPENYIAMFNAPNQEEAKIIIDQAEPSINELINSLKKGETLKRTRHNLYDHLVSAINPFFYAIWVNDKKYLVKDNCNGCGLCERTCPLNNIKLVAGKPTWQGNCTQCMACICHCPKEAIEYGEISVGKPRYHI